MSDCIISYPDKTLTATLSGGSWNAAYPLNNLKNPLLSLPARSSDADVLSTQFKIVPTFYGFVKSFAILRHNLSASAFVMIWGGTQSDPTVDPLYFVNQVPIFPEGYIETDRNRYLDDFYIPDMSVHKTAANPNGDAVCSTWLVRIFDPSNTHGYAEFSRCFLGGSHIQPTTNLIYGSGLGLETDTTSQRTYGGVDYYDYREPRRVQRLTLDHLDESDAFDSIFNAQWNRGIDKELLFITDPTDTGARLKQRSFLGTMRQLNPIEYPYFNAYSTAFEIAEIL